MLFNNIFSRQQEKLKNKKPKLEIEILENKLKWIAQILTGTKLEDFIDYLSELQKDIRRLKEMWDAFEDTSSFSEKIVLGVRIPKKINIILEKIKEVKKRINLEK